MSDFDDICSAGFKKEWRMVWARAFIEEWLSNPDLRCMPGMSMDSLTSQANYWIRNSVDYDQPYPIVSSEDIREAGFQILGDEEVPQ